MTPDELNAELATATATLERQANDLYRDGTPMYAPAIHNERMAALNDARRNAVLSIVDKAAQEAQKLQRAANAAERMNYHNPLASLSATELARAAQLERVISRDLARSPADGLGALVQSIATTDDTALKAALLAIADDALEARLSADESAANRYAVNEARRSVAALADAMTPDKVKRGRQEAANYRRRAAELERWAKRNHPNYELELRQRFGL
jgi:hypothetical protein